jgi:hypothetical protein
VLLNTLLNLLAKVATSPLSLLGGLVGGSGEELQFIEFLPGQSNLSETEVKKLGTLAKVLEERPGLFLEIGGTADPKRDRVALAERKFMVQLHEKKRQEGGQSATKPGEEVAMSKDEEARLTNEWYAKEFPVQPSPSKPELSAAERRDGLVATMVVGDVEIRQLAQDRAAQIRDRLLQPGVLPEERLVLRDVQVKEDSSAAIRTPLTLAGR